MAVAGGGAARSLFTAREHAGRWTRRWRPRWRVRAHTQVVRRKVARRRARRAAHRAIAMVLDLGARADETKGYYRP